MYLKGQILWFSKVKIVQMTLLLCLTLKSSTWSLSQKGFIMKVYKKIWRKHYSSTLSIIKDWNNNVKVNIKFKIQGICLYVSNNLPGCVSAGRRKHPHYPVFLWGHLNTGHNWGWKIIQEAFLSSDTELHRLRWLQRSLLSKCLWDCLLGHQGINKMKQDLHPLLLETLQG